MIHFELGTNEGNGFLPESSLDSSNMHESITNAFMENGAVFKRHVVGPYLTAVFSLVEVAKKIDALIN
ncbi:hypothetical protein [Photobacterium kishitanii]|uniref:Uncharacterized protein n=1 Tax=Photobacterium kishitanii TaxID=318456 RepID=A0A2T3KLI5_9GAMM|nr:hypothetical protein [Photobacterium kishitanii]PSV00510.1 hypothetical protein C9J27_05085 [Photobacterium kishitanii]